jgi:hypothetical protein
MSVTGEKAAMPVTPGLRRVVECAAIACFALASFGAIARVSLEPIDESRGVGVVFAPWVGADEAFARAVSAGARFVRYGGLPFIVVVMPETEGYAARTLSDGALLVVDPLVLEACLSSASRGQGIP